MYDYRMKNNKRRQTKNNYYAKAIKMKNYSKIFAKRNAVMISIAIVLLILLVFRIGYIQFVEGSKWKEYEYRQSTANRIVSAKRGIIYDANGKALALSADVDTVSVNPEYLNVTRGDDSINEEATKEKKEKLAQKMAEIFELKYEDVLAQLTSDSSVEVIARKVEKEKVEALRTWLKENDMSSSGINVDSDIKRYYPYNNLASNLIGCVGANNQGLDGVESEYDSILAGTNGKITTQISVNSDAIPDEDREYIPPENGSNIYLTIDSNIQAIAEKYLKQAVEENYCERGGNIIIMDPTTGEILAMATYPDYNLNDPFMPNASIAEGWDDLTGQEQTNKIYAMWRNRAVLDTYEPGSTFKVITASIAVEENLVSTDVAGDFYCSGSQRVAGWDIYCADTSGHGSQSLREALMNSCNPAFIQLGQKIGATTFYKYLKAFGLFEETGIDLPSEGQSSFWDYSDVGPVELATMSFGQRFTITPIQMIRAASAIANDGKLVTPHVVKAIENTETGTITQVETQIGRQVISKETADKLKSMMQSVVDDGGGRKAQVRGYSIGGKTGTSEPDPNHPEDGYVASFLAIAPVQNTKLSVLLTLYDPEGDSYYGGSIAAPAVSQILTEVLQYLDIPSNDAGVSEGTEEISVPEVRTKTLSEAERIITGLGLTYSAVGESGQLVATQVPAAGTSLTSGGVVKLYTAGNDTRVSSTVPDVKNVSLSQARIMLNAKNLNISSTGTGVVISQTPAAGESVDEGTVVKVVLQEQTSEEQH